MKKQSLKLLSIEAIEAFSLPQLRYHLQQYNLPTTGGPKGGVRKFLQEKLKAHILSMNDPSQRNDNESINAGNDMNAFNVIVSAHNDTINSSGNARNDNESFSACNDMNALNAIVSAHNGTINACNDDMNASNDIVSAHNDTINACNDMNAFNDIVRA